MRGCLGSLYRGPEAVRPRLDHDRARRQHPAARRTAARGHPDPRDRNQGAAPGQTCGMSDFARQQSEFQRGILTGDNTVLAEILDSPREKRETLFGVYRYAYGSRLVDAMRNDHQIVHPYICAANFYG